MSTKPDKMAIKFDPENYSQAIADRIKSKYQNRIPVLVWEVGKDIEVAKRKFIVPTDITIGQFLYVLRKQLKNITAGDGIFLFITDVNTMLPAGDLMGKIYNEHNVDGFLRLTVTKENAFGQ
jgi:GABA(A) receptor-associated protein